MRFWPDNGDGGVDQPYPKLNGDCCRESERKAFASIFSPNNDEYPDVGMQPFDAEPYHAPKGNS
jgi:hypothetical protein